MMYTRKLRHLKWPSRPRRFAWPGRCRPKKKEEEEDITCFSQLKASFEEGEAPLLSETTSPRRVSPRSAWKSDDDVAENCEVFGDGVYAAVAGERAVFSIAAGDGKGARLRTGGLRFEAILENGGRLYHLNVTDCDNGIYECSYRVSAAGDYELSVLLNGETHLFGSPFSVCVNAGESTATCSRLLRDRGLRTAIAGVSTPIRVEARDRFGNVRRIGGDAIEASVDGPAAILALSDNGDGTYEAVYEVDADADTEEVRVSIMLRGNHVKGSPFSPNVIGSSSSGRTSSRRLHSKAAVTPSSDKQQRFSPRSSRRKHKIPQPTETKKEETTSSPVQEDAPKTHVSCENNRHEVVVHEEAEKPKTSFFDEQNEVASVSKEHHAIAAKKKSRLAPKKPLLVNTIGAILPSLSGDAAVTEALANARLREVFDHYSRFLSASIRTGRRLLPLEDTTRCGLGLLARDFEIVPNLLSRKQLAACFAAVSSARRADPAGLTYDQFTAVIALVAVLAFSKPHYDLLQATDLEKVTLLLERWGVADPIRFAEILRRKQ